MKKTSKVTNIVIVNDFDYIQGGASKVAIDTANLLAENEKNVKVYFFSGNHSDNSNLNEKVTKICTNQTEALRDKNKFRGFINGIYNIKAKKEFEKLLNILDINNTIIHVHGWTKCLSSSVFDTAFKKKFKVVLTMHDYFTACPNGGYFDYQKNEICYSRPLSLKCIQCNCDSRNYIFKLYRILRQFVQNKIVKLNQKLENVISISDFSEKVLVKTLNPNVKITRIYNPINIGKTTEKAQIKKNNYFLYVGRVSKEKGVDLFCEAITDLNLKGIVVGDGDQKDYLANKFPNVEFVGWKSKEEVRKYMLGAKGLIFPSRWYEGAPLTTMEALSVGVPCIVSDTCAASDIIIEGENGYLFNIKKNNLKEKINKLVKTDLSSDKINLDFYERNNYTKSLLKLYINILENKEVIK